MLLVGAGGGGGAGSSVRLADCLASDSVEDTVYITGPEVAGRIQVAKADIDDGAKMPVAGVILLKLSATLCQVQLQGELTVAGASFASGNIVFTSAAGKPDTSPPARPASGSRLIQRLGIALSTTRMFLSPDTTIHEIRP